MEHRVDLPEGRPCSRPDQLSVFDPLDTWVNLKPEQPPQTDGQRVIADTVGVGRGDVHLTAVVNQADQQVRCFG